MKRVVQSNGGQIAEQVNSMWERVFRIAKKWYEKVMNMIKSEQIKNWISFNND